MNLLVNLTQYGYGTARRAAEHASLKTDQGHVTDFGGFGSMPRLG
jgi:hypothetical protein